MINLKEQMDSMKRQVDSAISSVVADAMENFEIYHALDDSKLKSLFQQGKFEDCIILWSPRNGKGFPRNIAFLHNFLLIEETERRLNIAFSESISKCFSGGYAEAKVTGLNEETCKVEYTVFLEKE